MNVDGRYLAGLTVFAAVVEAGTFAMAAAVTGGEITVRGVDPAHLAVLIDAVHELSRRS